MKLFSVSTHFNSIKSQWNRFSKTLAELNSLIHGAVIYMLCRPELANAGLLSKGLCRGYRALVDDELFMVGSVIALVILIIAFKFTKDSKAIGTGVGILAALTIGLNIENMLQLATGKGAFCN